MAVLLPRLNAEQALLVAERIRFAIAQRAIEHSRNMPFGVVTASIGVATAWPFASIDKAVANGLIAEADAALYEAKRNGRNRVKGPAPTPAIAHAQ